MESMVPEQGGDGEKDQSTVVHSFISPSLPFLTCKMETTELPAKKG